MSPLNSKPVAGQVDAAPGVAGRVIDFKRQLIDGKLVVRGPVVGEDVGRQRQQLVSLRVNRVHIDLAPGRLFQRGHRADMVIVAVGQQDASGSRRPRRAPSG